MAVNRRIAALLLEFKIARGEVEQSKRMLTLIKDLYEDLGEEVKFTDRILASVGNRLSQVAQRTRGQSVPAIDELRDSLNEAADATERLNEEQARAGRGGGFGGIQRIGRLAANVPGLEGVAGGLNIADDVIDAAQSLPDLKTAIAGLGPVALIAAPAIIGVSLALNEVAKAVEEGKKQLSAAIDAQNTYYDTLQTGTTESVARQLKDLNDRRPFLEAQIAETQNSLDSAFAQAAAQFGDAAARALDAAGQLPTAQLREQLNTLRAEFDSNVQTTFRLETALKGDELAANDAAAAHDALTAALDRQIANEVRILSNVPKTTEALEQRLEQINREQEVLRDYMNTAGLSEEATRQLQQQFADLSQEESLLSITLRPLTAEIEAAAEAAQVAADKEKQLAEDRERAGQEAARIGDQITKLETEIADIRIKSAEKLADIEQARLDKIADAARDRDTALAEAEADAADARNEAIRDSLAEREKAEVEHQKALKRIQQEFNRDSTRAIEDRDAVALFRAQEARDEALANEKDANKERLKEIDTNLRETNRQIDRRLIEQRNTAIARYNEQLRIANEAARKAIELEQRRAQAEIQQRQAAINQLLQQQQAYQNAALGLQKQFWDTSLQLARNAIGALGGTPAAGSTPIPKKPPKLDTGGVITKSGMAYVHAGEVVYNQRQQRGGLGSVNIPINVTADRKEKILREVWQRLSDALDEVA